jgi:type IV pilus assembly protein PilV
MRQVTPRVRIEGFSLVEVMVAVVVICIGLLGIAKLQALSLSNMTVARQRSLAAIEAAGLASSMHSNRLYWASAVPPALVTWSSQTNPAFASSDAALAVQANADVTPPGSPNVCVGTVNSGAMCAGAAGATSLAAADLALWAGDVSALMPNAGLSIQCPPPPAGNAPQTCTIQMTWTENAVGVNKQESAAGGFQTPTYTLVVEP